MSGNGKRSDQHAIILFDGVCHMCHAAVQFIIPRDPARYFRFASLQSRFAREQLEARAFDASGLDSVVLIEGERVFTQSTAALRVCRKLNKGWPALYALIIVPRPLRDAVYRFIAKRRYRWFGKSSVCMLPTPEHRSRFLDQQE